LQIRYYILILILLSACQGTHGKIKSYTNKSSKNEVKVGMESVGRNVANITFFNDTDDSGIDRSGYIDILIETPKIRKKYKVHFYGGEKYWEENPNFCRFSIIKINGNTNKQFGILSKDKRIAIELFEREFIPHLEKIIGEIEFGG